MPPNMSVPPRLPTEREATVLAAIGRAPGLNFSTAAKELGISRQMVDKIIDRLLDRAIPPEDTEAAGGDEDGG